MSDLGELGRERGNEEYMEAKTGYNCRKWLYGLWGKGCRQRDVYDSNDEWKAGSITLFVFGLTVQCVM